MIELPPSKSIGARFLVATFFSGTLPADPLFDENDDLLLLQQALLEVYSDEEPIDYGDSPIDVGASGTALRFVTAVCASTPGADYVITGTQRLMERPMAPMLNLLRDAGAGVDSMGENGRGPYRIIGKKLKGGSFYIPGDISSQFISALMLVAPFWDKGMTLTFTTPLISAPYVTMTAKMMEKFGVKVFLSETDVVVPHGEYKLLSDFKVEADWSAASFFYEACAISGQEIGIADLDGPENSLQGDAATVDLFYKLGVESAFDSKGVSVFSSGHIPEKVEADFKDNPDLFLPFAVACLCKGIKFCFTGVRNLRLKESDRINSLILEGSKLGFKIKADIDSVVWEGELTEKPSGTLIIDPHEDHRVAMAFAMAALKFGEIKIQNPQVVEKSFTDFWNQLADIGLSCEETNNIMTLRKL